MSRCKSGRCSGTRERLGRRYMKRYADVFRPEDEKGSFAIGDPSLRGQIDSSKNMSLRNKTYYHCILRRCVGTRRGTQHGYTFYEERITDSVVSRQSAFYRTRVNNGMRAWGGGLRM